MLGAFWHWYTSYAVGCDICGKQDNALIAIASVAAVCWTGGLIAYQIKQYTIARLVALDVLQASFFGAVLGLFLTPLEFRYVATFFTVYYTVITLFTLLYVYRDFDSVKRRLLAANINMPDDDVYALRHRQRRYSKITLATMLAYIAAIIWPYPVVIAGVTSMFLFMGYQTVVWQLNNAKDKI